MNSGVARKKITEGAMPLQEFFQWMKNLLCDQRCPQATQIEDGG